MDVSAETLEKVSEIVRTELPKRLPDSIRVHRVKSEVWMGYDEDFIHVTVVYEGERGNLNPRMLNEFDQEIKPFLEGIGVGGSVPISYANRREVDPPVDFDTFPPQGDSAA